MKYCLPVLVAQCRVDAGKVELDGAQYLGFSLPFTISQLLWIEALLVGGAEIYRNSSTNLEERIYPGALAAVWATTWRLPHAVAPPCIPARI